MRKLAREAAGLGCPLGSLRAAKGGKSSINMKNYMGMGLAVGIALGAGLGVALHSIVFGVGIGLAFGIAFGTIFGSVKRNQNSK